MGAPFRSVLVANRGAIACRIFRTLRRMEIESVAVYSEADIGSAHVAEADAALFLGPAPARESYLAMEKIIAAAKAAGAGAIHPGYGFLSENADFAQGCAAAGLVFIGPRPETLRAFGLKHHARAAALRARAPLAPGSDLLSDWRDARAAAAEIGYPVMVKASAGGGGIGMRVCADEAALEAAFETVRRLADANFGGGGVFLERFVARARHVEVQVFGDGQGRVLTLGDRDCSLQRRNQKVIEEAPAPDVPDTVRVAMQESARALCAEARYLSAGTVEFLYDPARLEYYFLEVNTRLQVEHGVTEEVFGVDLVEWMVRGAAGDFSFMNAPLRARGAAIQARIYAEDPLEDFRPSAGVLSEARFPSGARVETWVSSGADISTHYDPMLAKIIVRGDDRDAAIAALGAALDETAIAGVESNVRWLRDVLASGVLKSDSLSTRALEQVSHRPNAMRVLRGGAMTTVQDYPGRLGLWAVGVPPSGPMDALSFRLGNALLGNAPDAAGLEAAAAGPRLRFLSRTLFCLAGADFGATLDGAPAPLYAPIVAEAGQVLDMGRAKGPGLRGYVLVRGGFAAPPYAGAKAAFTLGGFGGVFGRALAAGDLLHLGADEAGAPRAALASEAQPPLTRAWEVRVLHGPHGAPDFFTDADIETLLTASWRVHYNSSRTGVRLEGPKPAWARRDGGEAGLHPSNIHDTPYAVGAVDFTGDMPIILGPDGPSLGGFVCPFVIILADLWKVGQFAPGDSVRFIAVTEGEAVAALRDQNVWIETGAPPTPRAPALAADRSPILAERAAEGPRPRALYRRQGEDNILIEFGDLVLDIELRARVHALMRAVEQAKLDGVIDVTPGVRSLQVHFDAARAPQCAMLQALMALEEGLGPLDDFEIPSRTIWLPLSWQDPAVAATIVRYCDSVRDDAPWTPDNVEFIRRINGLQDAADVERIVFDARYLVLGLGDVYLGAPVATPLDPRHRLVTTKYNPARTWTPPNVVGIGGAYMCIYGMEGPGGYQLFGRTIQVWSTYRPTAAFQDGAAWLLRFFDQIRFFPVAAKELEDWRRDFPAGRRALRIEEGVFRLADYRAFLRANADAIGAFARTREAAFAAERAAWEAAGEFARVEALALNEAGDAVAGGVEAPEGCVLIEAPLGGLVWRIDVAEGDVVREGQTLVVIEAMKSETAAPAPFAGRVRRLYASARQTIAAGAPLLALEPQ